MSSSNIMHKIKSLGMITSAATIVFAGINIAKSNENFLNDFILPIVKILPPETSHRLAVVACKYKIMLPPEYKDPVSLETSFFGQKLSNPIGIAAGFDKHGEAIEGLEKIGFGFIEIGSVTPQPQPGNPKPRVFRLPLDYAVINRYGFNSHGHAVVFERLLELRNQKNVKKVLGINLGKNKTSDDALSDYIQGVEKFGYIADYLVINISSPNTPGLRNLQKKAYLENLLCGVISARNKLLRNQKVPVFLKLSPDLTQKDINDIIDIIDQEKCKIDGLIISNTTIDKTNLKHLEFSNESGGLSGAPLKSKSTKLIAQIYNQTNGKIPIIGVGGVFNADDAYEKILAGASYVQLYTAFIYSGPTIITQIKKELDELLRKDGYKTIGEAVGKKNKLFL